MAEPLLGHMKKIPLILFCWSFCFNSINIHMAAMNSMQPGMKPIHYSSKPMAGSPPIPMFNAKFVCVWPGAFESCPIEEICPVEGLINLSSHQSHLRSAQGEPHLNTQLIFTQFHPQSNIYKTIIIQNRGPPECSFLGFCIFTVRSVKNSLRATHEVKKTALSQSPALQNGHTKVI